MFKKPVIFFMIFTVFIMSFINVHAEEAINANAYVLCELNTGEIIDSKNASEAYSAAGTAKLMSYLLFFECLQSGKCKIEDMVQISSEAAKQGGTQVFLDAGKSYPFGDLLQASIMCSANDATVALAEYTFGSEKAFVEAMNARAKELGLTSTFTSATGLDDTKISAQDLALIAAKLAGYSMFFKYSSIWMDIFKHSDGRETQMVNPNKLVKQLANCDGMCTGSSTQAGYCGIFSIKQGGARYLYVIMGAPNSQQRFAAAIDGLNYATANFTVKQITKKDQKVKKNIPVENANIGETDVYALESYAVLLKKGEEATIEKKIEMPEKLSAPIASGDVVGELTVNKDGKQLASIGLYINENIEEKSYISSLITILSDWLR